MKPKKIVKFSNIIGLISIVLLIYWVFMFILTEACGFKIFERNFTELFYMSIMGILALMAGALMINLMFNLTRIANRSQDEDTPEKKSTKILKWGFIISFPLIFLLMFVGNRMTISKKEQRLISAGESIVKDYSDKMEKLADYKYSVAWIQQADTIIQLLDKTDKYFPHISVIVNDTVQEKSTYLSFTSHTYYNDTILSPKLRFVRETTQPERVYLKDVFDGRTKEIRFSKYDGRYELFYPYTDGKRIIVLYFSEYDRYGKVGSYK